MIDKDAFGLKDFKVVESSEAAMLSQLKRATRKNEWMVFLGREPHPMNTRNKMKYLSGGESVVEGEPAGAGGLVGGVSSRDGLEVASASLSNRQLTTGSKNELPQYITYVILQP